MPKRVLPAGEQDKNLHDAKPLTKTMNSARFDQNLVAAQPAQGPVAEDRRIDTHPRVLCGQ